MNSYAKAYADLMQGAGLAHIWAFKAWHDMTAKYKRTFLGTLWLAGSMVITALSLALVWGAIMGRDLHEVLPYIITGILSFQFIMFVFSDGPAMFTSASGVIKNHAYPFTYYVFERLCNSTFTYLHNLIIVFIVIAAVQASVIPHWSLILGLPVVLVTIFCWGTVVGVLSARFRDLQFMLPHVGQLLFYVTPVIWSVGDLSQGRAYVATFNPLYGLLEILRAPILGQMATDRAWLLAILSMFSGIIAFVLVFPPLRRRIPFWV